MVITDVMDVDREIRLYFYVSKMGGGVIPPQAVVNAVKVTLRVYCTWIIFIVD